ncbi:GNAT family N-acetyltransferase [Leeuwenhoekiella sp. W20_SRS_FM14]|uniref:GNAT family N-acetyltransferase n=1 Tax=Leeuwenhoekiella sp. W20_SRS_FM14 TaxID=3240270 RepID=UPI003F9B6685
MNVHIRIAESNDMAQVLRLIKELAVYEKEPDAVEVTVDDLISYGTGDDADFTCFIAEREGEILGIALVYFRFSTWKGRTVHLEDLIVRQQYRGEGIGMALYTEVIKYTYKLGLKRVEWVVLDWNTSAVDFYKASGANVMREWNTVQMDTEAMKKFLFTKGMLD